MCTLVMLEGQYYGMKEFPLDTFTTEGWLHHTEKLKKMEKKI